MDIKTILALFAQALLQYLSSKQAPSGTTQQLTAVPTANTDYDTAMALLTFIRAVQSPPGKP